MPHDATIVRAIDQRPAISNQSSIRKCRDFRVEHK
eukprot:SAG11_NODE_13199_length_665_cov_46.432862_1_plen_34_part_01